METTAQDIRWSVGDLARASGLTVRTLHHWDAIGLLVPSERTGAGHRRYTGADVQRLYRVLALRRLGLPLGEVAAVLEREGPDLRAAVQRHLARVDAELAAGARLRERLVHLLAALDRDGVPAGEELIDAIEVMTMHERYYSDEQLGQLAERREQLGPEGMEQAHKDWADLIAEVRAAMDEGVDPADPRAQALGERWEALIERFTGGDPGIRTSLKRMYEQEGAELASRGMVDADVMAYAARIREASGR
jgi:MerR family transcriptional regulator, thiopeptide resistance regulator